MLSRKDQNDKGIALPKTWCEEVEYSLNNVYEDQKSKLNKSFFVCGKTFPNELLIGVSFLNEDDDSAQSLTVIISADIKKDDAQEDLLKAVLDSFGILFDEIFSVNDWNDYHLVWKKFENNKKEFHFQISRENLKLSLMADKILNEDLS